ncbi:unnamed protein product [Cylindrotheca closterium]|uniref:Uncharacterized protein n=1 Tax=Cylindrotheca closterium TaxID=2856 RepID=A0AAD2GA44_9STRA|nr:unnamed protein product [Cylindrotheca closterium]
MFIFGTRMFGQTDRVPGLFYVATKFFHINFVPLCPLSTYLVIEARGLGPRGISVPMSSDSLIVAWLRAFGWIIAFAFALMTVSYAPSSESKNGTDYTLQMENFAVFLGCFFLFCGVALFLQFHSLLRNASYGRATEICSTMMPGGSQGLQRLVDQHFGMDVVVMASAMIAEEDGDMDHMEMAVASSATAQFSDTLPGDLAKQKKPHRDRPTRPPLPTATVLEVV